MCKQVDMHTAFCNERLAASLAWCRRREASTHPTASDDNINQIDPIFSRAPKIPSLPTLVVLLTLSLSGCGIGSHLDEYIPMVVGR